MFDGGARAGAVQAPGVAGSEKNLLKRWIAVDPSFQPLAKHSQRNAPRSA